MEYEYQLSQEHNIYPNMTVHDRFLDGEPRGWRVTPNDGYVMYDTTDENYDLDPETDEEIPVTNYYTIALLPRNYSWQSFSWVAVPRDSVDEKNIF